MSADSLHAELRAHVLIDSQLETARWHVCDLAQLDLIHHPNCGVREVRMKKGSGLVDDLLYVRRKIGWRRRSQIDRSPWSGVGWQFSMHAEGLPPAQQLQWSSLIAVYPSSTRRAAPKVILRTATTRTLETESCCMRWAPTVRLPRLSTYDRGAVGDFEHVAPISDPASRLFGAGVPAAED